MADVVRLAPRLWDGQRLLRFLAGLAMLALAFAAHAGLTGPAAITAPATSSVVTVVESEPAVAAVDAVTDGDEVSPATRPVTVALLVLTVGVGLTYLWAPRSAEVRGIWTRGPPLQ